MVGNWRLWASGVLVVSWALAGTCRGDAWAELDLAAGNQTISGGEGRLSFSAARDVTGSALWVAVPGELRKYPAGGTVLDLAVRDPEGMDPGAVVPDDAGGVFVSWWGRGAGAKITRVTSGGGVAWTLRPGGSGPIRLRGTGGGVAWAEGVRVGFVSGSGAPVWTRDVGVSAVTFDADPVAGWVVAGPWLLTSSGGVQMKLPGELVFGAVGGGRAWVSQASPGKLWAVNVTTGGVIPGVGLPGAPRRWVEQIRSVPDGMGGKAYLSPAQDVGQLGIWDSGEPESPAWFGGFGGPGVGFPDGSALFLESGGFLVRVNPSGGVVWRRAWVRGMDAEGHEIPRQILDFSVFSGSVAVAGPFLGP